MSAKGGQMFDAAISYFKSCLKKDSWALSDGTYRTIEAAIRVLEQAAKVDKGSCFMFLEDVNLPKGRVLNYELVRDDIRALIESIPGE